MVGCSVERCRENTCFLLAQHELASTCVANRTGTNPGPSEAIHVTMMSGIRRSVAPSYGNARDQRRSRAAIWFSFRQMAMSGDSATAHDWQCVVVDWHGSRFRSFEACEEAVGQCGYRIHYRTRRAQGCHDKSQLIRGGDPTDDSGRSAPSH